MASKKEDLEHLLKIEKRSQEDIFGVLGRMQVLLAYFKKRKKHAALVPFLETYYLVTKEVARRGVLDKKYFKDPEQLEQLDIHFASLYFKPLLTFLTKNTKSKPWKEYYNYCSNDKGIPFVQMFLGINSHINADLVTTLAELNYNRRPDFLIINEILENEIPRVMTFLAFEEHDIFGLGGVILRKFVRKEFKKIVVSWRNQAWKNSLKLRKDPTLKTELYKQTGTVAKEIIHLFEHASESPQDFLPRLQKLRVVL